MDDAPRFCEPFNQSDARSIRAQDLKAALLRHPGRKQEALQTLASASYALDPLDVRAMAETYLASEDIKSSDRLPQP